jgi:hypothetical protein
LAFYAFLCAFVCFSYLLDWSNDLDLENENEVDNSEMRGSDSQTKSLKYEKI